MLAAALPVVAHPSDRELQQAREERERCAADPAPADPVDAGRLAMSEAELRSAVEGLRQEPAAGTDPREARGLERYVRQATDPLAGVEYELWQDRVYRIRWRLATSFERPVLDELSRRARTCFGEPEYDQTFEAEPGSPKATLRRIGWRHGDRQIELRQLHPLRGGPVYLSVSRRATLREIGTAGVVPFSEPDRSAPWWQRSLEAPRPVTPEEREELGLAVLGLLSQLDH